MTAGRAGRDLSRITTGLWQGECSLRSCRWDSLETQKATAIRNARIHAAATGHDVILIAETRQRVSARPST